MEVGKRLDILLYDDGSLHLDGRLFVYKRDIRDEVLEEAH